jgi:glycosyltransferase involved in cell wall biosynthesis
MHSAKKILFVSGFLPSSRVPSGGQKLVCRILKDITASHEVTLLAFCNENEAPYLDYADFKSCAQVKIFMIGRVTRAYAAMRHPHLPMIACARYEMAHDWLRKTLSGQPHDIAWFEFIQCASLMSLLPRNLPSRLVVHDLFHQAHERKAAQTSGPARVFWQWEADRTKQWESRIIKGAREVITLTEKDKQVAQTITGRSDIAVRYPQVEEVYHGISKARGPRIVRGLILFWGQLSRRENEDAVIWFVRKILPSIRLERPNSKLVVAGANPGPSVLKLACGHVEVRGFVADPVLLFESAEIAIAPLRLGAGVKIKVAEYLAAGIPSVATTVGAEGIRPSGLLHVADGTADFGNACVALMAPQQHE